MGNKTYNLRPIWDELLAIYGEIAKVCDKHNLRHYLAWGSLIGAVRHGGFIPWDDDLDICMPRPDFERFQAIAKSELPVDLAVVNWRNTPEWDFLFARVQLTDKKKILDVEEKCGYMLSGGLCIDIFPIDGYISSTVKRSFWRFYFVVRNAAYRFKTLALKDEKGLKGRLIWLAGMFLSVVPFNFKDNRKLMSRFEKVLLEKSFETSEMTGISSSLRTMPCPWSKRIWEPAKEITYDRIKVRVPNDCDAFLRPVFGEYMNLPPESARYPSHGYAWRCPWWLGPTSE